MSTKSKFRNIVLSFVALTLAAAITYYADSPTNQSVATISDSTKL
ncbi:hypothetical protein MNBD_GAMMA22-1023 [hydrothermal vent metagenome]|uniref:Uncharacterized protein n=1 Tax=hydrothermal vent metagenome TaxID=652676 RepID=A0A3B1AEB0_9ZZZZ